MSFISILSSLFHSVACRTKYLGSNEEADVIGASLCKGIFYYYCHMNKLVVLFFFLLVAFYANAQATKSKIILKNGDIVTGKILELKPNEYVKIEAIGNNVLTIQYSDIKTIYLDENEVVASSSTPSGMKEEKPLKKFYFESYNEGVGAIGIGKVYGVPFSGQITLLNTNSFGGFYSANGVGYDGRFFLGIGLGINGNAEGAGYSIPYTLDLRYRIFKAKKFSPLAIAFVGAEYLEAGLGTFTFSDGLGLSIKLKERFNLHVLLNHTFVRFMPNLSLENGAVEAALGTSYYNYFGIRLGVAFKI